MRKFRDVIVRAEEASGGTRAGMARTITISHSYAKHKIHRDTHTVASHSNEWARGLRDWDHEPDEYIGGAGLADRFL